MNINMSEIQFNKLIELCRGSRKEISGIMNSQINNGEIYVSGIKLDENTLIDSSTSNEIIYNSKAYIPKIIYEIAFLNSPVYISFHTHPSFGGRPCLSKTDIENLKYVQSLARKVTKLNHSNCTNVIEGIITDSEIAFYTYDLDSDRVVRLPFFVDEIEKIPSIEKSKFKFFKEGFLEGRKKLKR